MSAPKFGVRAIATPVLDAAELESAITALGQEPDSALFVVPDVFVQVHRALIIRLAEKYRVPAIYPYRFFPSSGGLLSYGFDTVQRIPASRIVCRSDPQGRQAGGSPVQAPASFKLVINLKAAQAIGLTMPASFLLRADEVIE